MKRLVSLLFVLSFLLAGPALARCVPTGQNVLAALKGDDPALAARIEAVAAAIPNSEGLTWRVTDPARPDTPLTLFGTMHLSDARLLDLPPAARDAFAKADTLVLEITEILDPQAMARKAFSLLKFTTYTDGTTLSDRVSDAEEAQLRAAVTDIGLPWSIAQRMKPWALMAQLALPACERAAKAANEPFLDIALGQQAIARGLDVRALETIESQLTAMDGLPADAMVKALVATVGLGGRIEDMFETMVQLYEAEDIGLTWAFLRHMGPEGIRSPDAVAADADAAFYAAFQRAIVDERNLRMATNVAPMVGRDRAFVAVGALHLPGETGLVAQLRQRGFTVERLR